MGGSPIFYLYQAFCGAATPHGALTIIEDMIELPALLEKTLSGLGYELVMLERAGRGLMRIYIDKPGGIMIEDCVSVSNHLSQLFTVENIDYDRLEVSSPGIDRPLTRAQDYVRFAGEMVALKLRVPMDKRKRMTGRLIGLEAETIKLDMDGVEVSVDLRNVESARLKPEI
jgi:ribosome maturation factor RimP